MKKTYTIRPMKIEDYEGLFALWMTIRGFGIRSIDDSKAGVERFLRRNPTPGSGTARLSLSLRGADNKNRRLPLKEAVCFYYVNLILIRIVDGAASAARCSLDAGGGTVDGGGGSGAEAGPRLFDFVVGLGHGLLGAAQGVLAVFVG